MKKAVLAFSALLVAAVSATTFVRKNDRMASTEKVAVVTARSTLTRNTYPVTAQATVQQIREKSSEDANFLLHVNPELHSDIAHFGRLLAPAPDLTATRDAGWAESTEKNLALLTNTLPYIDKSKTFASCFVSLCRVNGEFLPGLSKQNILIARDSLLNSDAPLETDDNALFKRASIDERDGKLYFSMDFSRIRK